MTKYFSKSGFTLAEVLITLLIIGVVASIVIPNLLNDSRNAELDSSLKKVYAELSQTTKQIIMDNGGTFVNVLSSDYDYNGFVNSYKSHMSISKSCYISRSEGCWHPYSYDGGNWITLAGINTDGYYSGSGIILNNGILINFVPFKKDCTYTGLFYTKPSICGWIIADVNGFKSPNTIGKDIFYFNVLSDRLEPWGVPDSKYQVCSTATQGLYCAVPKLMQ